MASAIPRLKKTVSSFLLGEEGKISKQSILSVGLLLSNAAIATILTSDDAAAGWHNSHSSHTSHTSHSSHASHNQHSNAIAGSFDGVTNTVTGTHTHHANFS